MDTFIGEKNSIGIFTEFSLMHPDWNQPLKNRVQGNESEAAWNRGQTPKKITTIRVEELFHCREASTTQVVTIHHR